MPTRRPRTRTMSLGPRRHRRVGAATGAWLLLGSVFGLTAALVDAVSLTVTMVVCCGVALTMAAVAARTGDKGAVPARSAPAAKPVISGGRHRAGAGPAKPGTPAAKARKPRRCSPRCRRSTKATSTCDCVCKGRAHGSEAPGGPRTVTASQARGRKLKSEERKVVRAQKTKTP